MVDPVDFVRANTTRQRPALLPEIELHLAAESLPLWQKTEDELGRAGLPPPYWAFAWAGGQALARYVLDNPEVVAGKRILDLGCGGGMVAIAALKAGAVSALAADLDGWALAAVRLNGEANAVTPGLISDDLLASASLPPVDVVLVGDLFYEAALAAGVVAVLERSAASGARIFAGDPRRSYFPADRFVEVARFDVATSRDLEDADIKSSAVWRWLDAV